MKCASRSPRFASAAVVAAAASSMLAASAHATTYTATFASWDPTSISGNFTTSATATGLLGSTSFTVSNTSVVNEGRAVIKAWDLSSASNYAAPGSSTQQSFEFNQGNTAPTNTTITFASAVSDLALYTIFWRVSSIAGTYTLVAKDASNIDVAYSFLSGSLTPTVTNNTFSASGWLSGIIQFSGAVKSITFTTANTGGGTSLLNLATLQASAIPGSGVAAIGTLGLAGIARRRRR